MTVTYLKQSIMTVITFNRGSAYPIAHLIKMRSGYKLVDSMGRSYGYFKNFNDVFKYIN